MDVTIVDVARPKAHPHKVHPLPATAEVPSSPKSTAPPSPPGDSGAPSRSPANLGLKVASKVASMAVTKPISMAPVGKTKPVAKPIVNAKRHTRRLSITNKLGLHTMANASGGLAGGDDAHGDFGTSRVVKVKVTAQHVQSGELLKSAWDNLRCIDWENIRCVLRPEAGVCDACEGGE